MSALVTMRQLHNLSIANPELPMLLRLARQGFLLSRCCFDMESAETICKRIDRGEAHPGPRHLKPPVEIFFCQSSKNVCAMRTIKVAESFRASCELLLESFHDRRSPEVWRLSLPSLKSLAPHRLRPRRIA
jgi:hypothetical protein